MRKPKKTAKSIDVSQPVGLSKLEPKKIGGNGKIQINPPDGVTSTPVRSVERKIKEKPVKVRITPRIISFGNKS